MEMPPVAINTHRKVTGENVLRILCELEIVFSEHDDLRVAVFSGEIAAKLGRKDGRAVAGCLSRLDLAGLVRRTSVARPLWRATAEGRKVDALLASITHARGGKFQPWTSVPELRDTKVQVALR